MHASFVGAERGLRVLADPLGELRAFVQEPGALDDAAHEADAVRLLRVEPPPGDEQVERDAEADDVGQPLRQARLGPDVPAPVHDAEGRMVGRDPDVARHRELHAAREAVAVDRGDDRLPDVDALRDAAQVRALVRPAPVPLGRPFRDGLDVVTEVRARAERLPPRAGQDRDVELRIVPEIVCPFFSYRTLRNLSATTAPSCLNRGDE
jgi:hypothetical protein